MPLIDTHAHLDDDQLRADLDGLLQRAEAAGLTGIITVGTTATTSEHCVALAEKHRLLWSAVGVHPNYCHEATEEDYRRIAALVAHPKVVAIGETGLDRYWQDAPWDRQLASLQWHVQLSRQSQLPLILHMRECGAEMLQFLTESAGQGSLQGVLHSFTGDWELARQLLDLGLYISFAGMLTYKKSVELRDVAARIPMDRLLVETDSPYLSPEPFRGKRPNEPARVVHTLQCLADTRQVRPSVLAEQTTANAVRLFARMGTMPADRSSP